MRFSPLRRSDLQRPCSICDGDYQMRRSCFFRSPAWGCCCRSLGEEFVSCSRGYGHTTAAAARGRPAPRCSSARSGTPPPCTPTPSLRWQISWCIP